MTWEYRLSIIETLIKKKKVTIETPIHSRNETPLEMMSSKITTWPLVALTEQLLRS